MTDNTEIFRHYRPKYFDKSRHDVFPLKHGGISFLLKPSAVGIYSYWIYICPANIPFSVKQAVKTLRDIVNNDVVPWGEIKLNPSTTIIDQLIKDILQEQSEIPSDVAKQVLDIFISTSHAECMLARKSPKADHFYVDDLI